MPANLTGCARQQAKQRAQERGFARAHPPGHNCQRAARELQIDFFDAAPALAVAICEFPHLQQRWRFATKTRRREGFRR